MPVAPVVSSDTKRGDKSMEPESVMTDKMREEFEKWASGKGLILRKARCGKLSHNQKPIQGKGE